jgi:hypothetical protein
VFYSLRPYEIFINGLMELKSISLKSQMPNISNMTKMPKMPNMTKMNFDCNSHNG